MIHQTDLAVSRIAYGCGHLSFPKLDGFPEHLETADVAAALTQRKSEFKKAFAAWTRSPVREDEVQAGVRIVQTAFDAGITLFDHADIYGWGKSEAVFGAVIERTPGLRQKIVIQTKCGIRFAEDFIEPQPFDPHRMDLSREHLVKSAEGSLRRLHTDYVDILLLHRPDPLAEPEEIAAAFDLLHRSGKVRYFGVSNHTPAQIELLKKYVRQPLVVNQLHVGLAHVYLIAEAMEANRDASMRLTPGYAGVAGTLDYCRLHNLQIQAWSPLKNGANQPNLLRPSPDASQAELATARKLGELAQAKDTTPSAVALAWLLRHPARFVALIGTTNPHHLVEDCAADRIELSRTEWYELFVTSLGLPSMQLLEVSLPAPESQ